MEFSKIIYKETEFFFIFISLTTHADQYYYIPQKDLKTILQHIPIHITFECISVYFNLCVICNVCLLKFL